MRIGLVLPMGDVRGPGIPSSGREIFGFAREMEQAGFDSLWLFDHLQAYEGEATDPTATWEAWTLLAGLAATTERASLGTIVTCTGFRPPALLARMAHSVHEISGGRLILGLGAGWHEPEYQAFGYPFDHRYSRFEEALTVIRGMLVNGSSTFDGRYYRTQRRAPAAGADPANTAHNDRDARAADARADREVRAGLIPYPDPIKLGNDDCSQVALTDRERGFIHAFLTGDGTSSGLNDVIEQTAQEFGFHYLTEMQEALAEAHLQLCDPLNEGRPGLHFIGLRSVQGIAEQRFNPKNWSHSSLHPNERGHAAMLRVFSKWLAEQPDTIPARTEIPQAAQDRLAKTLRAQANTPSEIADRVANARARNATCSIRRRKAAGRRGRSGPSSRLGERFSRQA